MNRFCIIFIVFFVSLFAGTSIFAESFLIPEISDEEVLFYQVRYHNKKPEERSIAAKRRYWEDTQAFRIETKWVGQGMARHVECRRNENLFGGGTGQWVFAFAPGTNLTLESFIHAVTFPTGRLFHREAYSLQESSLAYPEPLFHPASLGYVFRSLEFTEGKTFSFWLWNSPLLISKMQVKIEGKETVDLPIGPRECWKLVMKSSPDNHKGMAGFVIKRFLPEYYFWVLADKSHALARSEVPLKLSEEGAMRIQELCFIQSDEYPEGMGKKPVTTPSVNLPEIDSGEPFKMPLILGEKRQNINVRLKKPVKDINALHISRQIPFLESATRIDVHSRAINDGEKLWLDYYYTAELRNKNIRKTHIRFLPGSSLRMKDVTVICTTPSGKIVQDEYIQLDDPDSGFPDDLVHPLATALAYQGMTLVKGGSRRFSMLIPPNRTMEMKIKIKGVEEVSLNNGTKVRCYRFVMNPVLAKTMGVFGKIVQPFVPDFTWWLSEKEPHSFIRYRGSIGGISSGKRLVEILEVEDVKVQ